MSERAGQILFSVVACLIIVGAAILVVLDKALPDPEANAFTVTATSEWVVEVDIVKWKVRCMVFGSTASNLKEEVQRVRDYVLNFLKTNGFKEEEITLAQSADTITAPADKFTGELENSSEKTNATHLDFILSTRNLPQMEILKTKVADFYTRAKEQKIWINIDKPEYSYSEMDSLTKVLLEEAIRSARAMALDMKKASLRDGSGKVLKHFYDHSVDAGGYTLGGRNGQKVKCTVVMEFHTK
ncbi:MAG: SIMPL domain-containing protein [Candidatus Methylacidiphilales bacterium]|nr:SIMPL domain-containing protein [Candidatus Methylacidiphilales bacterium]